MFLGIGRIRFISRRLLDGLHHSDVVAPKWLGRTRKWFNLSSGINTAVFATMDCDRLRRHGVLCAAAVDSKDNLGHFGLQTRHLKCGLGAD